MGNIKKTFLHKTLRIAALFIGGIAIGFGVGFVIGKIIKPALHADISAADVFLTILLAAIFFILSFIIHIVIHYSLNIFSEIPFYELSLYIRYLQMFSFDLNTHEISLF